MSTSTVDFETADAGGLGKRRCTAIRQSAYKQRNLIVVSTLQEINPAVGWSAIGHRSLWSTSTGISCGEAAAGLPFRLSATSFDSQRSVGGAFLARKSGSLLVRFRQVLTCKFEHLPAVLSQTLFWHLIADRLIR
jgi:hypothetical protein